MLFVLHKWFCLAGVCTSTVRPHKHRFIVEEATKVGIERLEDNLKAPVIEDLALDESDYDNSHLLSEDRSPVCRFLKTKKSRFVRSNKAA